MIIRKALMAAILLLSGLTMKGQTTPDTLVIKDADKVTIETTDTAQHIIIKGARLNSDFKYEQRIAYREPSVIRRTFSSLKDYKKVRIKKEKEYENKQGEVEGDVYLNLGLSAMTGISGEKAAPGNDPISCKARLWPSLDIGFGFTANWYPFGNKNCWSIGLGFNWRYYRFSSDTYWVKTWIEPNGWMQLSEFDHTEQHDLYNALNVFSLQIPVFYTHTFDKDENWKLMLGGFVNFNTSAHASYGYTSGDNVVDVDTYGIGHRPVTIDFMVAFDAPCIPMLYCKYSPTTFFKDDRGPKMRQLSFGFWF